MGVGRPLHKHAWADYRAKHYIEAEEYTGTTVATRPPPPVLSDPTAFPSMEAAATVPNPARSRLAPLPKKGSSPISHSYAADAPVSIITSSPSAPSTSGQSSALPVAPPMPVAAPASPQPASFSHAPLPAPAPLSALLTGGLALPPDELMPQVTSAHLEQGGIHIEKGVKITSLRPIIHPPVQPRSPFRGLPAPSEPPPLHQIFAEAFSRLPPIHSYMAGFCQTGRDLYNFLFSGTPPTPPAETTLDDPMGADPPPASTDGVCLLLFPTTHMHPTGPLHSLRTLCALRHGMFHIGKDRVDLDSFAAFLTQPDTVEFAQDGITIDSCAPFTRESWLFTHQITSYGAWTFLPLALRLTMHSARFELTLALRQEVPKPSCFQVAPDLFHWQGHLLDGVRVTLSFGIGCLELASDTFVYVRFPYPEPGSAPQLEAKGWTLTPDCGSYFFSRASHSLGHLHPSRPGVVDPSDYARPASLLKWPATSPATRSRYAHLPHHHTPDAPPKLLPAASIPYYHMGMDQLCQPAVSPHSGWPLSLH